MGRKIRSGTKNDRDEDGNGKKTAKISLVELPQLKITAFKGTAVDWVRFENMFLTKIDSISISEEEKFEYLLESVIRKVRDRISNLKQSTLGYKTVCERLMQEYGQIKVVINSHLDQIINLPTNYEKIQEFYDQLSKGESEDMPNPTTFLGHTLQKIKN